MICMYLFLKEILAQAPAEDIQRLNVCVQLCGQSVLSQSQWDSCCKHSCFSKGNISETAGHLEKAQCSNMIITTIKP